MIIAIEILNIINKLNHVVTHIIIIDDYFKHILSLFLNNAAIFTDEQTLY